MWDRESDLVGERTLHVQLCASSGKILDVEERDTERECVYLCVCVCVCACMCAYTRMSYVFGVSTLLGRACVTNIPSVALISSFLIER